MSKFSSTVLKKAYECGYTLYKGTGQAGDIASFISKIGNKGNIYTIFSNGFTQIMRPDGTVSLRYGGKKIAELAQSIFLR